MSFGSPNYTVDEWEGGATITVTMDVTSTLPVTVTYSAVEGTASTGSDFVAVSDTLAFTPGITLTTFTVPILDDGILEPGETVSLTLSQPTNATLAAISTAALTILDDDAQSQVFLPLVTRNHPTTSVTGRYVLVGNPCITNPCQPGVVYAVDAGGTLYHLTVDSAWLWQPHTRDGYTPEMSDLVTVTGYMTEAVDIRGGTYLDLEVLSLVPAE